MENKFSDLCSSMKHNRKVKVEIFGGVVLEGIVKSIQAENDSGKNWIVKLHNQNVNVLVKTK